MAVPGQPQNFLVQTGNQSNLVSWNLSPGATSYQIQRSLDNVTFTTLATVSGSPLAMSYLDTAVLLGVQYWYTVAASSDGINYSLPTISQSAVPTQSGEQSLGVIRLAAQQRADRVNSNFVTTAEWNNYINQSMYELYDLLITTYEDYFLATPVQFVANGNSFLYPVPDGSTIFQNGITLQNFTPPALYKLYGVDLALQNATNAFVTVNKFNFVDRNRFVFPNTASTIYGVFNLQYRLVGNNLEFIPPPSANQTIRLWYVPRLTNLLKDTDTTVMGISGWIEYVIVKAAYYALTKEESDTTSLVQQLVALTERIQSSATNRDQGQPDKISDTRINNGWNGNGSGWNGGFGGFAAGSIPLPILAAHNLTNHSLANIILYPQSVLGYVAFGIQLAYFLYLYRSQFGCSVLFSRLRSIFNKTIRISAAFIERIGVVDKSRSDIKVLGITTGWIVAGITNIKSFWNRTISNLISNTMRPISFLFSTAKNLTSKFSVPIFVFSANPRPAFVRSTYDTSRPYYFSPCLNTTHSYLITQRKRNVNCG